MPERNRPPGVDSVVLLTRGQSRRRAFHFTGQAIEITGLADKSPECPLVNGAGAVVVGSLSGDDPIRVVELQLCGAHFVTRKEIVEPPIEIEHLVA